MLRGRVLEATVPDETGAHSAEEAIRQLVREELDRARAQIRHKVASAARGVATLALAFFVSYVGVVFLTLMAVYVLGTQIEPWMAAAIVGGALLVWSLAVWRWALAAFRRQLDQAAQAAEAE